MKLAYFLLAITACSYCPDEVVVIEPSRPRLIEQEQWVRYLSVQIFNRESDVQFERLFLNVLQKASKPRIYPELVEMREHIQRELQYRCQSE